MKQEIKFGTDGWRGIVGFDYTEEKIKIISSGISEYLKENQSPSQPEKPFSRHRTERHIQKILMAGSSENYRMSNQDAQQGLGPYSESEPEPKPESGA